MKYTKLRKNEARKRYNAGETVLIVGDNVNSFHFEDGWHLAIPINKDDYPPTQRENDDTTFDYRVNQFEHYLARELGRRAAYYVKEGVTT